FGPILEQSKITARRLCARPPAGAGGFQQSRVLSLRWQQIIDEPFQRPWDRKIILAAIAHSDLRDLQLKDYFLLVQYMAAEGEDTTVAAFHILAEPKFQVFVPEHSLTLAQNYCLVYMLLPTNPDFWIQPAIDRLRAEKDVTAQKSLLLVLWYGQTPASDKTILDFAEDATKTRDSRDYAIKLVRQNKE